MKMKKYFTYPVFLILFLSFILAMGFGAVVQYHNDGGKKFQFLQKSVLLISSVPQNIKKMIDNRSLNLNSLLKLKKHTNKEKIKFYKKSPRNSLLILPRYIHSLKRPVVEIIDLNNFEVLHTYKHDIKKMNNLITNKKIFPTIEIDNSPMRFEYWHPLVLGDGSLIADGGTDSPLFKIDLCSNLVWLNDNEIFHHSKMLDHEGNIWVGGRTKWNKSSYSNLVKEYNIPNNFNEDTIIKINTNGNILKKISVLELLIENRILPKNFAQISYYKNSEIDPIHINDIEPALQDSIYWKKGDIFLSAREISAIIHYRPSTNKVINYITGPFSMQHDVDIISNNEISIFNNNNYAQDNKYSEVLIYNFETNKFKKHLNYQLKENNFKTRLQGLSHMFKDGAFMIEEQEHGRIILFNNKGKKEWEFINVDKNGDIGYINWSRVIEDELFVESFKSLVKNKKCLN